MMTANTRDLLEYAALDALGLLDDAEREEFERAFRAASPEVQAMVRREQTRAADIDAILPRVEAPAGLKQRVVDAWRDAVAAVAPEPVGAITPELVAMNSGLRTGYLWRAACLGFATASLVLAGFFIWGLQMNNDLRGQIAQNKTLGEVSRLGPGFLDTYFAATRQEFTLTPVVSGLADAVHGRLLVDTEKSTGVLVFQKLPADDGAYRVVLQGDNGEQVVANFRATGGLTTVNVDFRKLAGGAGIKNLERLAVVGPVTSGSPDAVLFRVKLT